MDRPAPTIREVHRYRRCRALATPSILVYPRPAGPPLAVCADCARLPHAAEFLMLLARPLDRDAPETGDDAGDR
jgi:hypothetical protein